MNVSQDFYMQSALELAPKLLGKLLCRRRGETVTKLRITETECYCGETDTACHAHKGRTPRTEVMYRQGGCTYIYLCYGIHSLLNIVAGAEGSPEAVLLRGLEHYNGPGKLTKALEIDRSLNAEVLTVSEQLWLEDDGFVPNYKTSKRIGIEYAGEEYRNKLWRFTVCD